MCYGFTWASEIGVCVVPGVLVILEHIQASGLRKYNLCEFKNDNANPMFQDGFGWNKNNQRLGKLRNAPIPTVWNIPLVNRFFFKRQQYHDWVQ